MLSLKFKQSRSTQFYLGETSVTPSGTEQQINGNYRIWERKINLKKKRKEKKRLLTRT